MLLIYYLLRDNKSFLCNDQLVVIIYQMSCKIKLVVSNACIYISKAYTICTTLEIKFTNREMARRVTDLCLWHALLELKSEGKGLIS